MPNNSEAGDDLDWRFRYERELVAGINTGSEWNAARQIREVQSTS